MVVASSGPYANHLHPATNHIGTSPLKFLQAGCPYCRPTNSIKALKDAISERERILNMVSI